MGLVTFDLPLRTPLITHTDTHVTHDVTHTRCLTVQRAEQFMRLAPRGPPLPTSRPHIYRSLQIFTMASTGMVLGSSDHSSPSEQMTIKIRRTSHPIEDRRAVLRLFINEKPR